MIYCFARPDQMDEHNFKDDVAVCKAISKKRAIQKFSKLYDNVKEQEVFKVKLKFRSRFPKVLTDY